MEIPKAVFMQACTLNMSALAGDGLYLSTFPLATFYPVSIFISSLDERFLYLLFLRPSNDRNHVIRLPETDS